MAGQRQTRWLPDQAGPVCAIHAGAFHGGNPGSAPAPVRRARIRAHVFAKRHALESVWRIHCSQELIRVLSRQLPELRPLRLEDFDWTNVPATGGDLARMLGRPDKPEKNSIGFTPKPPSARSRAGPSPTSPACGIKNIRPSRIVWWKTPTSRPRRSMWWCFTILTAWRCGNPSAMAVTASFSSGKTRNATLGSSPNTIPNCRHRNPGALVEYRRPGPNPGQRGAAMNAY